MLIAIDNWACDDYIAAGSYNMSEAPEYGGTDYVDGWWRKHRTVVRKRVAGTVTLALNPYTYTQLIDHLKSHESAEGSHSVLLYVSNANEMRTVDAYVTLSTTPAIATKAFNYQKVFFSVVLTIEER